MRPLFDRIVFAVLLLLTLALFAPGCASDGSYSGSASVGVYGGYGYYGGYPGYYGGNVVVGAPVHPGGVPPSAGRPSAPPPHASQMPAPAPRPMPSGGGGRGGGGRR